MRYFYTRFKKEGDYLPDGNLVFNTKIDEKGFDKGAKNLSSKTLDLKNKIAETTKVIKNLQEELEKTANTKVKTKTAESIERDIAKAQEKLNELDAQADRIIDKKRSDFGISVNDNSTLEYFLKQDKEWEKLQEKIAAAEAQLSRYQSNLRRVNESAPLMKDTAEYKNKQQRLDELTGKLDVYKAKLYETEQAEQREAQQTANASGSTKDYKARLNQTITALKMLERGLGKAYNGLKKVASNTIGRGIKSLSSHFKKANSSTNILEKSLRRIKNTLVRMFFFRLVHSPIDAVKDGLGEISKISPQVNKNLSDLKTSSSYLKNSFATLAAPLLNLVTPAFVKFMDVTAEVTDKVARLIAVLSGQNSYTKAVRIQQDYAASLDESTESLQNNTKAAEENQKSLAGFDELNVMQDNSPNNTDVSPSGSNPMFSNVETQVTGLEGSLLDALKKQDWNSVGSMIGDKVNSALSKFNWTKIKKTAKQWATNIANLFNGFLASTDWNLVGKTAAEGVNTVISFMLGFSYTFDWALFGRSLRESLVSFFKNIDKDDFITAFDNIVNGLVTAGIELVGDPAEWRDWGTELESSIMSAIKGIKWEDVKTLFRNLLAGVLNFGDGFFGNLFSDIDKELVNTDFTELGNNAAKDLKKIDWEKIFGNDSTIGKFIKVISDTVIAGLDYIIGFLEEPGTADKIADGFEVLMDNVPWEEIIIKSLTIALFDLPAWITDFATRLIEDFCDGLATGFQNSEDDKKLNKAALGFAKSLGNLIITIIESLVNLLINALPNLVLGALKLLYDLVSGFLGLFLGEDFYKSATNDLWGSNSFHFDWKLHIPRLATGTVVPANYGEFLAVLGDNKREPEVVSPVSQMKQAFLEALAEGSYGGNGEPAVINLNVDGETWFSWLVDRNNRYKRTHGSGAF